MVWRLSENPTCREPCDACRRDGHECLRRWAVIDDECRRDDSLVAFGFTSKAEAEAYIRYPEVQRHPQPRH
jgi:hypothetical protein